MIHGFKFAKKPFLVKPNELFFYDYNSWLVLPDNVSFQSLKRGSLEKTHALVIGTVDHTICHIRRISTVAFVERLVIVPFVDLLSLNLWRDSQDELS